MESSHVSLPMLATEVVHRFSSISSTKNVELTNNNSTAVRGRNCSSAIVFSTMPLQEDELFEIRLDEVQLSNIWQSELNIIYSRNLFLNVCFSYSRYSATGQAPSGSG